jgi:signal transduction histidine kinase
LLNRPHPGWNHATMTLRLRLFALLAVLAGLLAGGEWLLVRALSADLETELATAAATVGEDLLRLLRGEPLKPLSPADHSSNARFEKHVFVVQDQRTISTTRQIGGGTATPALPSLEHGVIEEQTTRPDGRVVTERHDVDVRLAPGSARHVLVLHGAKNDQGVPVPTSGVDQAVTRFRRRLLLSSLGLFAGALLLGVAVTHRFTRPLRELATAARQVGAGELGVRAPAAPGEVGEAVIAFNQMSERLLALDAEARRLRASEQLSELGEVARGLAHSLRNPLNALGLAIDRLGERGEATETAEVAAAARRQIRRIDTALRAFLALSAGDAAPTEVDLAAVARDVALEGLQARPTGEAPRVAVVAGAPVLLTGVEAELRAALQALVVNAVEASPPGGTVTIRVAAESAGPEGRAEAGRGAVVTVDDQGPGLPTTVRERLFTPHVTTKPAGAGIGLYLAHRLATGRYAGELTIADRPPAGTRATLRLRDRVSGGGAPA